MIERITPRGPKLRVTIVTTMPAAVNVLTASDPNRLPLRSLSRLPIIGLNGVDGLHADLIYLPTVSGNFDAHSTATITELAARLANSDLVIDLCDFAALYRRGQTKEVSGAKEYTDFLSVLKALGTVLDLGVGKIFRPQIITTLSYDWRRGKEALLDIHNYTQDEDAITGKESWWADRAPVPNGQHDVMGAQFTATEHAALQDALNLLDNKQGQTLNSRVMISDFSGDTLAMVRGVTESRDPVFTRAFGDIEADRKEKYELPADFSNATCAALVRDLNGLIDRNDWRLVDGYHIAGSPGRIAGKTKAPDPELKKAFAKEFPYTFAFLNLWNALENENKTADMNRKVNGWYMSNSTLSVLAKTATRYSATPMITSWAIPLMATNSVGFFPNADAQKKRLKATVLEGLRQLANANAFA